MKKVFLAITLSLFAMTSAGAETLSARAVRDDAGVYDQKKDDKKKNPPGPPVVRDKGQDQRPKEPPKKGKKPE